MVNNFLILIRYEILMTLRQAASWVTPLIFFIIIICLFPLALDANKDLLHKIAPGIIWVAALLSILISIGTIFINDLKEGCLEQLLFSPYSLTLLVACKVFCFWLTHCLPLILISPVFGLLLDLSFHEELALIISLLLGTPILCLLGAIGAALIVGIRGNGLLLPILIMPLYIPILIFGTGTLFAASANLPVNGYFAIMGALLLFSLSFAPLLTGMALKIGVNQ